MSNQSKDSGHAPAPTQQPTALEAVAKAIYEQWAHIDGWKPWVAGGNATKQDEARSIARAALAGAAPTPPQWPHPRRIAGESDDSFLQRAAQQGVAPHYDGVTTHPEFGAAPTPQPELTDERIAQLWYGERSPGHDVAPGYVRTFTRAIEREVRTMLGAAPTQAPQQPVAYTKLAEYEVMAGCYHLSEPAAQWTRKLPEGKYVICATPTEALQGKENQQ